MAAGSTVTTIQNVGRIRTRGLELAAQWRVLESLELSASVTYAHSRIVENDNFPDSVGQLAAARPGVARHGARELAAARSAFGHVRCALQRPAVQPLDNSDPHGTAYTGTSHYLVYDTRLRMTFGRLSAALGVDNLGNERYWAFHPYSRRTYNAEIAARL